MSDPGETDANIRLTVERGQPHQLNSKGELETLELGSEFCRYLLGGKLQYPF